MEILEAKIENKNTEEEIEQWTENHGARTVGNFFVVWGGGGGGGKGADHGWSTTKIKKETSKNALKQSPK